MKRTYYKVPIIGLQLLLFFSYIALIFFYLYKLDKEVAFFDIPIKYTKSSISDQTYGIGVTGSTGSTTVHFKSDSFPNKEFRAHYYKSLVFTRGFFRAIEKERLPSLGCYLEPSFLHSKEKEVPFFYSEQEKDIFYYLGLISYMKDKYFYLLLLPLLLMMLMCFFTKKIKSYILIVITAVAWCLIIFL